MRSLVVAALAAAVSAVAAEAQMVEVTLSGGRVNDAQGAERTGVSLVPVVTWTDGLNAISLNGGATLLDGGDRLWSGGASAGVELVSVAFASLDLTAGGQGVSSDDWRGGSGTVSPRLTVSGLEWRASAGPVWGVAAERWTREVASEGFFGGDARVEHETRTRGVSGVSVEGGVVQGFASVGAEWTGLRSKGLEWEELGLNASVVVEGVTVAGSAGTRFGGDRASWGGASAAFPVGGDASLIVEGGRFPSDVLLERAGGRYLTVGLRVRG